MNIILDRFLPRKDEYPKDLHKAMRYSVFAGGKRLRPYLTMTAFEMFNPEMELITPVAAAIEMIHTIPWFMTICRILITTICDAAKNPAILFMVKELFCLLWMLYS